MKALDAAEAAARIGSDAYAGALIDMRAGTIQPLAYARGLARAAIAAGAAIHTQSPVRAAERTGRAWTLTNRRGVGCRPTGSRWRPTPMAARRGRRGGASRFGCPISISPRRRSSADLQAVDPAGPRRLLGHADDPQLLPLRPRRAARVRQRRGFARNGPCGPSRLGAARARRNSSPASERSPFEHQWYGMIGMTDGRPAALPSARRQRRDLLRLQRAGHRPGHRVRAGARRPHSRPDRRERTCRCRSPRPTRRRCRRCGKPITRRAPRSPMRPADGCDEAANCDESRRALYSPSSPAKLTYRCRPTTWFRVLRRAPTKASAPIADAAFRAFARLKLHYGKILWLREP